jgi:peptide/nickel transport system permease protein
MDKTSNKTLNSSYSKMGFTISKKYKRFAWRLLLVIGIILMCWVIPFFMRIDPNYQDNHARLEPPSTSHILGTDNFGRDIFIRILYSGQIDLQFGIVATLITMVIGIFVGAFAGYFGKWVDAILMRILDIQVAFPFLVLIIAIIAMLGSGIFNMYIAVIMVSWTTYARLIRGEILIAKEKDYVIAAKSLGASHWELITKHLLPNSISPAIVYATSDAVMNILAAASLGFLGLGVKPPTAEWGAMISEGRVYLLTNFGITLFPGLAIIITGIVFSLLGDGLSEALRPDK